MHNHTAPIKAVDLFCGAGGLSLGLQQAGLKVIYAADMWPPAVATYRANLGSHVQKIALNASTSLSACDVFAGGPPCQGFSSAGRRSENDERNSLVRVYSTLIATHRPQVFIFENVEGFLTAGRGRFVVDLLDPLLDAGYCIHLRKANAANFGVAQHRKRIIAIGALGWDPGFPDYTHQAFGAPGAHHAARRKPLAPSLMDAIGDLRPPAQEPPGEPLDHYYRPLSDSDLARAQALLPGQRMRDLPEPLQHAGYKSRAFRRVCDGTPSEKRGGAPSGIRRLVGDEPSKAITGAALREFIHPLEHRTLTLRECARIQAFPDNYVFCGSQSERIQQIGNSVPVILGRVIGQHLIKRLAQGVGRGKPGALLSFEPTVSKGMSPALEEVCSLITARFGHTQPSENLWASANFSDQ